MLPNFAFFDGKIVPYEQAKVGVATHAFNYGTGAFAGVRAYWNEAEEQLFLFRPYDHFQRLLNSAKMLFIDVEWNKAELTEITIELLRTESYKQNVYIRPLVYKKDELIGVRLHDLEPGFTMFAIPFEQYVKNDTGAHVTFSSWRRVDDNMIPARGKITGTYINSAFIKTDAHNAGFDEALVLNVDGHVSEATAMNFFMVRGGKLITPPVTDNILEGITRRTVMELAVDAGIEVLERSIDRTEVYLADELFLTGTAAQVTAVTKVDHRPVGTGEMGGVTTMLRELFADAVRGKIEKYREEWNFPVY